MELRIKNRRILEYHGIEMHRVDSVDNNGDWRITTDQGETFLPGVYLTVSDAFRVVKSMYFRGKYKRPKRRFRDRRKSFITFQMKKRVTDMFGVPFEASFVYDISDPEVWKNIDTMPKDWVFSMYGMWFRFIRNTSKGCETVMLVKDPGEEEDIQYKTFEGKTQFALFRQVFSLGSQGNEEMQTFAHGGAVVRQQEQEGVTGRVASDEEITQAMQEFLDNTLSEREEPEDRILRTARLMQRRGEDLNRQVNESLDRVMDGEDDAFLQQLVEISERSDTQRHIEPIQDHVSNHQDVVRVVSTPELWSLISRLPGNDSFSYEGRRYTIRSTRQHSLMATGENQEYYTEFTRPDSQVYETENSRWSLYEEIYDHDLTDSDLGEDFSFHNRWYRQLGRVPGGTEAVRISGQGGDFLLGYNEHQRASLFRNVPSTDGFELIIQHDVHDLRLGSNFQWNGITYVTDNRIADGTICVQARYPNRMFLFLND